LKRSFVLLIDLSAQEDRTPYGEPNLAASIRLEQSAAIIFWLPPVRAVNFMGKRRARLTFENF
jgi:hypothetical protein